MTDDEIRSYPIEMVDSDKHHISQYSIELAKFSAMVCHDDVFELIRRLKDAESKVDRYKKTMEEQVVFLESLQEKLRNFRIFPEPSKQKQDEG